MWNKSALAYFNKVAGMGERVEILYISLCVIPCVNNILVVSESHPGCRTYVSG
jgi:hypothetical protein